MRKLLDRDFLKYPKLRHNLWLKEESNPDITYLTVSNGTYEIPSLQAEGFLNIRPHCTGHNSLKEISKRSSISTEKLKEILSPFHKADITHPPVKKLTSLSQKEVQKNLVKLSELFGEHLAKTSITNDLLTQNLKKEVVLGWLCETYHYIKFFPKTLNIAVRRSTGELKNILRKYAEEEKGHEVFILETLMSAGFKKSEIESSTPLVSTRAIQMILEDLFSFEPVSVFIVASIIESEDYHEKSKQNFCRSMKRIYGFLEFMWEPFFNHIKLDTELGHQQLLKKYKHYLKMIDRKKLDILVNKLHDLKHAFDLQALEIKDHYSKTGCHIPRQFVGFSSI